MPTSDPLEEQMESLASAVAESYTDPSARQAALDTMCEWGQVLLKKVPPGSGDRAPLLEALNAVASIAEGKPEKLLSLLREWPGAPMIGDMSRRQIVAEMRDACDGFARGESSNAVRVAAARLGHWAIDTVERPKRAKKRIQETARALMEALRQTSPHASDRVIATCAEVACARLACGNDPRLRR